LNCCVRRRFATQTRILLRVEMTFWHAGVDRKGGRCCCCYCCCWVDCD
jgi:hypothetical protein